MPAKLPERTLALANGEKYYVLQRPCKNGHFAKWYVKNHRCLDCCKEEARRKRGPSSRIPREVKCTPEELAYAAGFFDGEGNISIVYRKPRPDSAKKDRYPRYCLQCSVTQTRPAVIEWFANKFGGNCRETIGSRSYDDTFYRRWDWGIGTGAAALFLSALRPWLIVKAQEADIALDFQSTMNGKIGREHRVPEEVIAKRARCFTAIREVRAKQGVAYDA